MTPQSYKSRKGSNRRRKSGTSSNQMKKHRMPRARKACFQCRKAHSCCSDGRPCDRCEKKGLPCMEVKEANVFLEGGGTMDTLFQSPFADEKSEESESIKRNTPTPSPSSHSPFKQEVRDDKQVSLLSGPMSAQESDDMEYAKYRNQSAFETPSVLHLGMITPTIGDHDSVFGGLLKNSPTPSNAEPLGPLSPGDDQLFGCSPLVLYVNSPSGSTPANQAIESTTSNNADSKQFYNSTPTYTVPCYPEQISQIGTINDIFQLNDIIINDKTNPFLDQYAQTNPVAIMKMQRNTSEEVILACNDAFLHLIEQRKDQTLLQPLPCYLPFLQRIENLEARQYYIASKQLLYQKVKYGSFKIRLGNYVVKESFVIDDDIRYCKYDPVFGAQWDNCISLNGCHKAATTIPLGPISPLEQRDAIKNFYFHLQNLSYENKI